MSGTDKHEEWARDAKANADPVVLPEYTLLPASPRSGVASPPTSERLSLLGLNASGPAPAPAAAPAADLGVESESESESDAEPSSEGKRILRTIKLALLAIVLPPFVLTGAGLAASFAVIYGTGKLLEAVGQVLTVGPEALYRACVGKKARAAWRAARGKKTARVDVERTGAIAI